MKSGLIPATANCNNVTTNCNNFSLVKISNKEIGQISSQNMVGPGGMDLEFQMGRI